ncbi:hypothetical protein [Gimesia aquarii]|uniref:hypothetical protein n=1 Tax=Gimesia aquarii TaxID=2527964 RepID=UPI00119CCADE|nr:hypothetical protein [Gimesia aquarii]
MSINKLVAGEPEKKKQKNSQLIVRDVNVFLVSAHGKKLNDAALFRSTTPGYMLSRRLSADSSEGSMPAPLGLITFEGPAVKDIDVLIEFPAGRFLSHWPTARIQSKRIYWRSQNLLKHADPSMNLAEQHWLHHLQNSERLFVKGLDKTERFILYDVELNHVPRIVLSQSKDGMFQIQNSQAVPLQHVTIFQPSVEKEGWKLASIEQIPGVKKEKKNPDIKSNKAVKPKVVDPLSEENLKTKAKEKKANQLAAIGGQLRALGALPALAKPKAKSSDKSKAKAPVTKNVPAIKVPYSENTSLPQENILSVWEKKLKELGLGKPEITHVLNILKQHAFRKDQATIVYCMDEGYLDKIMPIEITPFPDVVRRVAIVIMLDVDPALQKRIDQLIVQLGDTNWEQREAAQKKLEEYGKAAQNQLQKAIKNKDLEIVFRAEQILSKLK